MSGATVETTLGLWSAALGEVRDKIRPLFGHASVASSAAAFLDGLLVRRSLSEASLAFFSTWCPTGTSLEVLVRVEGRRWAIEDAFETAKTELGLDHNETRSWHGWHRHVSLVMLAFTLLVAIRYRANATVPPPKSAPSEPGRRWSDGRSRSFAVSPAG
jgi:SRSO17 transposase